MINEKLIAEWREPVHIEPVTKIRRHPVRFIGGKYGARRALAEALTHCGGGFDLAVDPFGGSGLVSRAIKDSGMAKRVVYGDFDDYAARVRYIMSNEGRERHRRIRSMLSGIPYEKPIQQSITEQIAKEIEGWGASEVELDVWLPYLSFAGREAAVRNITRLKRYNCVPVKWPDATGWLDGLEIVSRTDARDLLDSLKPFPAKTLVVLDPPYPGSLGATYKSDKWTITDYINMINSLLIDGVDTILLFGDDRSGVKAMMDAVPPSKVKRIAFSLKTSHNAFGSIDSAYIIRTRCRQST